MDVKLEEQLKELMEQRDTVQSQLDNFRRVASEGNISDRTTRRWVLILIYCWSPPKHHATIFLMSN
jgi:hypothetical protein